MIMTFSLHAIIVALLAPTTKELLPVPLVLDPGRLSSQTWYHTKSLRTQMGAHQTVHNGEYDVSPPEWGRLY